MRAIFIIVLAVGCLRPSIAAANSSKVDALIERGITLREQGRDQEALAKFEEAYRLKPSGRVQAQIALAKQALGDWLGAQQTLSAALSTTDPWVHRNRAVLRGALETIEARLGRLELRVSVDGAAVRMNGRAVGVTPLRAPVFVPSGLVVIDVEAEGYWPVSRQIKAPANVLTREQIELVRRGPPPAPPPGIGAEEAAASDDNAAMAILGWSLVGGAAIGVGVGVAGIIIRNDQIDQFNQDRCLEGGRTREENCGDKRDASESAERWATAGFVAGGVLAVGAVVVLLLAGGDDDPSGSASSAAVSCGPGLGAAQVGCAVVF